MSERGFPLKNLESSLKNLDIGWSTDTAKKENPKSVYGLVV